MRPTGSTAELAVRRRIAGQLLLEGRGIREVARIVHASASSVKRWKDVLDESGWEGLEPKPHPGRTPQMTTVQKRELVKLLEHGPLAAGYRTEQWTCPRVADVIQQHFGVTYHADHVRRILHELGWSYQKPEQRARERDENAIRRWRKRDWPRIKKGPSSSS
jgi:transposase